MTVLEGTFRESPDDAHVALRQRVLNSATWFPPPDGLPVLKLNAASVNHQFDRVAEALADWSLVSVALDRPMTNAELILVSRQLGDLIPETAEAVQSYVEDDVVLNLVMDHMATADPELQPFAENPITFHTEGSRRSAGGRPSYLIFLCQVAPDLGCGGQTILMPVESVLDQLTAETRDILSRTHLVRSDTPPVLAVGDSAPLLSFRDPGDESVPFFHLTKRNEVTEKDVTQALSAVLVAIYDPRAVRGIHWSASTLMILDNRRFLHGRAFGRGGHGAAKRRLKRIRVRAG